MTPSPNEAINTFTNRFGDHLSKLVKQLLQSKHLYQSISIDAQEFLNKALLGQSDNYGRVISSNCNKLINGLWFPNDNSALGLLVAQKREGMNFTLKDAKLFCSHCDRVEPYNIYSAESFLERTTPSGVFKKASEFVQVFVLSYLCQSCKLIPEVFLVRRQGVKLTLSGRTPIEHISVPNVIPKNAAGFYKDALIAYQSGQTLAALFLLRTLIEQWLKLEGYEGEKADIVIENYMSSLPNEFSEKFPSFRELYSDLSIAIHSANGDSELFEKTAEKLEEHFDARRLFKLVSSPKPVN